MTSSKKISEKIFEKVSEWRADPVRHFRECIYIRDHNTSAIVPFELNDSQKIVNAISEKQLSEHGFVRTLLLKARRFGGSTLVQARSYNKTSLYKNKNAFIVAHEKDSTTTIFEMAKLMQERNPLPPATLRCNEKALKFDTGDGKGLKSEYRIACSDTVSAGRSQGIHILHCSEEAFWRDGATLLTGLLQTVPDPPVETEVYRESTAQGFGNSFQIDCFKAYGEGQQPYYKAKIRDVALHMPEADIDFVFAWKAADQDWVLVFIPWFMHNRYQKVFESDDQRQMFEEKIGKKVFDEVELKWVESESSKLRRRYRLSLEQLNWREWAIENKCRGNVLKFNEEYPITVEEAFLSSGSNVYPKELCDQLESECTEPIFIGTPVIRSGKTRLRRNRHGKLRIWEQPVKDNQYFMTIDSGGGENQRQKDEKTDPDPTCIDVWDYRSGCQVAQWHGHIAYDMIADIAEMIGNMYNQATACVEIMNHGYTVVADLKRAKYPQYEARPDEPGWQTNRKTKPLMVDGLYQMARDGQMYIKCLQTISEMRVFKEKNGSYGAETGCHDERVDTAGMASQMFRLLPSTLFSRKTNKYGFTNISDRYKVDDEGYQEVYANG